MGDPWDEWVFVVVFEDGSEGRVRVCAACEYDAWVTFRLVTGFEVVW